MYRKARLSAAAARLGSVAFLQLDAERGRICAAGGRGDLVLVVVADAVGQRRAHSRRAPESAGDPRMIIATVEPWVEAPLRRFVEDARARLALLLHPSGQVVAQAGFTRAVDVMTACALAAAVHATAARARPAGGRPAVSRAASRGGRASSSFWRRPRPRSGAYICLTVFDQESSLGLVRMFFSDLCRELATAAPPGPRRYGAGAGGGLRGGAERQPRRAVSRRAGPTVLVDRAVSVVIRY